MTTIAWDGHTLAADTQVTSCNNNRAGDLQKAWATKDGSRWAHTGNAHELERMRAWTEGKRKTDPPTLCEGGALVHITPQGVVREWWTDGWLQMAAPVRAWGSGERMALAAMMAGACARRAVEIAAALDTDTGLPVTVLPQP